ncbi:thiamine pyrophosphate-dependent enzyme [Novosphingobium sp.]|uniref:thiamine pyrophosphate-dependent enzyme n=1 Tax=Novosphingobium sp. TaxID=1874826 RepID=UPI00262433CB|nr:thiamine pyrophosphate-dependent enzyme [Novosphingobium sp.]
MARPADKAIAVLGNASAIYAIQGLHAAVQNGAAVSFVVIKNNRYEALHHFGRIFGMQTLVGTQFPELDFCKLAEGHGVAARRVSDAAGLDAALRWSLAPRWWKWRCCDYAAGRSDRRTPERGRVSRKPRNLNRCGCVRG